MNPYLQQIINFFTNFKLFPVISPIIILAVFAVIARIAVSIIDRMISSFYSDGKAELIKKLRRDVRIHNP